MKEKKIKKWKERKDRGREKRRKMKKETKYITQNFKKERNQQAYSFL